MTGLFLSCLSPTSSLVHPQEFTDHHGICSLGNDHHATAALLLRQHCTLLPCLITISSPIIPCQTHGRLEKSGGFAFVYMEDERDANDAIHRLDGIEFGRKGRKIRVEWTKEDRSAGRGGGSRRSPNSARPTKTLFVINFDPMSTRTRDLERHFDKYGRIANVRIKKNFAFVQFEVQEDATRALEGTNGSAFMDRVISVEYALRDDEKRNGYSPDSRGRDRRSPSPYGQGRERGSPDYGRGRKRGSPDYGRGGNKRNPDYDREASPNGRARGDDRGSPNYERERREASPGPGSHRRERREASPGYDRPPSRSPARDERD